MKTKRPLLSVVVLLLLSVKSHSQDPEILQEINEQVWHNFTKAFETSNVDLFGSIHSQNLIRVAGDSKIIKYWPEYIDGYKSNWKNPSAKRTINFRFIERIHNDQTASERGIYQLKVNIGTENEKSYYGKFHVILLKENNQWKLLLDYDSSESGTINEQSFLDAADMKKF